MALTFLRIEFLNVVLGAHVSHTMAWVRPDQSPCAHIPKRRLELPVNSILARMTTDDCRRFGRARTVRASCYGRIVGCTA